MPKVTVSHRVDDDLLAWANVYAKERGSTRSVLLEEALRSFKALSEGGVPDLPLAEPAAPALKPIPTLRRASSLEARRRANPVGMSRQDRINKAGS